MCLMEELAHLHQRGHADGFTQKKFQGQGTAEAVCRQIGGRSKLAFEPPDPSVSESSRSIARSDAPNGGSVTSTTVFKSRAGSVRKFPRSA